MSDRFSDDTLTYFIPKPQVESHFHIPGCHNLHVCPSACGRRNAIWALDNGQEDSVSFLNITEEDVVSGDYEELVTDAVGELLVELTPTPKAFMIYFKCIDDFLGTDEDALLTSLRRKFPMQRFSACHIDPVRLDENIPPGMRLQRQMFSFLEYSEKKDDGVNFLGNFVPFDEKCEIFKILSQWGIGHIRNLETCQTFEEYLQMANSRLNLVFTRMGQLTAKDMSERLAIPYYFSPVSYDIHGIVRDYQQIAEILEKTCPDFNQEIVATQQAIEQTKSLIGDIPVVIDSSATMKPLALARTMHGYGFNVRAVFLLHIRESDQDDREWIVQNCPQIQIIRSESYQTVLGYGFDRNCIAIGYNSAFTLQAQHFVNLQRDETLFGFYGVQKLMRLIRESFYTIHEWS